ncbi:MAG: hypothetical protein AVDCRST_MAG40-631, partial [uncultured Gemmatimonadaceae bacterium]
RPDRGSGCARARPVRDEGRRRPRGRAL